MPHALNPATMSQHQQQQPKAKHLILDAAPLLTSSSSSLRGLALNYATIPEVIDEIRDKTSRDLLNEMDGWLNIEGGGGGGLKVRNPSPMAVAKVTEFSKKTGDYSVLSKTDIRLLALAYDVEFEENGTSRIRPEPGKLSQVELEKEERKSKNRRVREEQEKSQGKGKGKERDEKEVGEGVEGKGEAEAKDGVRREGGTEGESLSENVAQLGLDERTSPSGPTSQPSTEAVYLEPSSESASASHKEESNPSNQELPTAPETEDSAEQTGPEPDDHEDDADFTDDSDAGEWITPSNVHLHKSRDLGLFPELPQSIPSSTTSPSSVTSPADATQEPVMKVACLTGDFAMQNVLLQMGLNVLGSGGKKVKEVRTWILRCHSCFKLCKDPTKKFCPSCGHATLTRVSITYTPTSLTGYILHLKTNYQHNLRGTIFPLPSPKYSSASRPTHDLVLSEDQKEWQRGVRKEEYRRVKEERKVVKDIKEGRVGSGGWMDPDWVPEMLLEGHGGGGSGRQGGGFGPPIGKDGLPVIGYGRRNPNQSRKKKR